MAVASRAGHRRMGILLVTTALIAGACGSATPSVVVPPSSPLPSGAPLTGSPEPSSVAQGSPAPTPANPGGIAWTDCTAPFQCATVSVPIDYAHPANGSIELALIRLPATDPATRIGDLLTNPGGPGESGIDFVRQDGEAAFSAALRAQFDIIGFDPRGVGASDPVNCVDGPTMDQLNELDLFPTTATQRTALFNGAKAFDAGCEAHSGSLLPFLTTIDAAKDMEQIRIALGDPKLTYLGFSYGTFLGSTYADLYPGNIRAQVLDGAVDATLSYTAGLEQQTKSFADSFTRFLAACAADSACPFYNGGQPGPAYDRLMAGIEATPLPATALGDPRLVGPSEAFIGTITALYDQSAWPILEQALAMAQGGDGSLLLELADSYFERNDNGTYANISAANTAINCADYVAPTDPATYVSLANQLATQIPRFGEPSVYFSLDCAYWPFHPGHDPVAPQAKGAPPIVVIGTTGDPATPYAWAQKLAGELSSAVLLTRTGEGHTAYGKSDCIDSLVDAYLLTLAVPKAGTVCPS